MSPTTFTESVVFIVMTHSDNSIGMVAVTLHEISTLKSLHFFLSFPLCQFLIFNNIREASNEALCLVDDIAILINSLFLVLAFTFCSCERSRINCLTSM